MSAETPTGRVIPAWAVPVVAGVVALAAGLGTFLVAAPFAAPTVTPPTTVEVAELPVTDGLMPLVDAAAIEPELAFSTVVRADAKASLSATLAAALATEMAIAAGDDPVDEPPAPIEGVTVFDPCPEAGGSDADCPSGSRATVLPIVMTRPLNMWIAPANTEDCLVENTTTQTGVRVVSNVPIVRGELRYEVAGVTRRASIVTTPEQRAAWDASHDAGEGSWGLISHCFPMTELPPEWRGTVLTWVISDSDEGMTRTVEAAADTIPPAPPSWVRPITRTALMISIPAVDVSSVRFRAIAVPFGQSTPSCDFGDDVPGAIEPQELVAERFSGDEIEAQGYQRMFVERHTAAFVVPEASTVTVCAGWVDAHQWPGVIPDHVYSQVLYSPDLLLPVVTVEGFEVGSGVRADAVDLVARISGVERECGTWTLRSGGGLTEPGAQLCTWSAFDGSSAGWDSALVVTATGGSGGSTSSREFVVPISPQDCELGCEVPEPTYVDVPVNFRDPCIGDCPASYLGLVRLKVEWEHGTRSWFGDWTVEDAGAPESEAPRLETSNAPSVISDVGLDGQQQADVEVVTDVPTAATLEVLRLADGAEPVVVETVTRTSLETERTMSFGPLWGGGVHYALRVSLTDADGDTSFYSAIPGEGRSWAAGHLQTEYPEVTIAAEATVGYPDGREVVVGSATLLIGRGGYWAERRGSPDAALCAEGDAPVPFASATDEVGVTYPETGLRLVVEFADAEVTRDDCRWAGVRPAVEFSAEIPYEFMLSGGVIVMTSDDGASAIVRLAPAG